MEKEVLKTITEYSLIDKGDTVIVGLSGGADSVSLMVCLDNLKEKLGIKKIIGVHVNHLIRDTAERDEKFSENLCKQLGADFYSVRINIKELKEKLGVCEEEAGRIARYNFFEEIKKKTNADKIATAHNKNDQTETFLMRMLRGGGVDSLASIKPKREDGVIRPLLNTDKTEILEYLKEKNQDYVTDETNFHTDYFRNKIRLELIGYLKENFGLKEDVISSLTDSLREDAVFLKKEAEKYFDMAEIKEDRIVFPENFFEDMPDAMVSRVIAMAVKKISGESILRENIKNIKKVINSGKTGKKADISKKVEGITGYGKFIIKKKEIINGYSYKIKPGRNYIKEGGFTVVLSEDVTNEKNGINIPDISDITVRTRTPGDKLYIDKVGHKKIKDFLIDKKIPRDERDKIPLICMGNDIICLYGLYKRKFKDCKYSVRIEWEEI